MAVVGPKRALNGAGALAGLVALSLLVFTGCDDNRPTEPDASGGAGGAGGVAEEAACTITMRRDDDDPIALDECPLAIEPVGGGLFRLVGNAADTGSLQLWLPSIEPGHYTTDDCLSVFAAFSDPSQMLVAHRAEFPDAHVSLDLVSEGDRLSAYLSGTLCDYLDPTVCLTFATEDLSIRIDATESDCACPPVASDGDWCEVGWCDGTRCTSDRCPAASALCQAL